MKFLEPDQGYRNEFLWLPKSRIVNTDSIKRTLTFVDTAQEPLVAWHETVDHLVVPREYIPYEKWASLPFPITDISRSQFPAVTGIELRYELRSLVQHEAMAALLEHTNGVVSLPCGAGKTVVALHAWAATKTPGLIVVHTEDLLHQWIERITEHTNLIEADIGVFRGDKATWEKPITVAMIRTLANRITAGRLPEDFAEHFGVVIYDECHHLGANYFNQTASVGKGLRWGLSATPKREDGLEALIYYQLGPLIYLSTEQDIVPTVFFVHTGVQQTLEEQKACLDRYNELNFNALIQWLSDNEERNSLIKEYLDSARQEDRKLLCLGKLVKHLATLQAHYGDEAGLVTGDVKGDARRTNLNEKALVFATFQLGREGIDRKDLDTLFIIHPTTSEGQFRQMLGRLQRAGGLPPIAIVFEDEHLPVCKKMCDKLRYLLSGFGYPFRVVRH